MLGRTFLRLSLFLPLVAPVLAIPFHQQIANFLAFSVFIGGLPYLVFVGWAWRRFGKLSGYTEARTFLLKVPVGFALIAGIPWVLWAVFTLQLSGGLIFYGEVLVFAFVVSFAYVGLVLFSLLVARRAKWVGAYAPNPSLQRTRQTTARR